MRWLFLIDHESSRAGKLGWFWKRSWVGTNRSQYVWGISALKGIFFGGSNFCFKNVFRTQSLSRFFSPYLLAGSGQFFQLSGPIFPNFQGLSLRPRWEESKTPAKKMPPSRKEDISVRTRSAPRQVNCISLPGEPKLDSKQPFDHFTVDTASWHAQISNSVWLMLLLVLHKKCCRSFAGSFICWIFLRFDVSV